MTKNKLERKPQLWIAILILSSIFGGIFTSIVGINNIQNYDHPCWFGFVFGGSGLSVGIWTALRLKPIIAVNQRMKNDYFIPIMFLSIGLFGLFLMTGSFLNQGLSYIDKCDSFPVIDKYRQESRYRQTEINSLIVDINVKSNRIICSRDYWYMTSVGDKIDLCLHKSKLGFGFITVTNDKKMDKNNYK